MKCKIQGLGVLDVGLLAPLVLLTSLVACGAKSVSAPTPPLHSPSRNDDPSTRLPLERIAIVGASVSAGFGGAPFGSAFEVAAPQSEVRSFASIFLFRDPISGTREQIDQALASRATTIVALDLLFWDLYGSSSDAWRERALGAALGELERARAAGSWIVVGDVPQIVNAAEFVIPPAQIPDEATLARHNQAIAAWARGRPRVVLVPFAAWAAPLASGGEVELVSGERVAARSLVAPDGVHVNALGAWALLDRLDRFLEAEQRTPRDALVFVRPPPE